MLKCEKNQHTHLRIRNLCDHNHSSMNQFAHQLLWLIQLCRAHCFSFSCQCLLLCSHIPRPVDFLWIAQAQVSFLQKVATAPGQRLCADELPVLSCRDFVNDQLHNIFSLEFYRSNGSDIKLCSQIQMKEQMYLAEMNNYRKQRENND